MGPYGLREVLFEASHSLLNYLVLFETCALLTKPRLGDSREHASEFKKARNIHVGEDDRDFVTPADVQSSERRGLEVYSEVGLVSESEFQRLVGCLPSSLGVKALGQEKSNNPRRFTPTNEEGQEQKSLHLLSLEGLSCCEIHSIRKVKLYWQVNLQMTEALLEQAGQLSDLHPHRVYQYNQKTMLETLPDGLRATGRLKLNTVAALREKHASLQAARQSKEVADPLEDGDASAGEDSPLAKRVAPSIAVSKFSRLSLPTSAASTAAPSTTSKRSTKKAAGADDVYLASTEDLDTVMQSLDPDMAKVAKVCKGFPRAIPACLSQMNVGRILLGEKLGRSIAKAGRSLNCVRETFLSQRRASSFSYGTWLFKT